MFVGTTHSYHQSFGDWALLLSRLFFASASSPRSLPLVISPYTRLEVVFKVLEFALPQPVPHRLSHHLSFEMVQIVQGSI